MRAFFVVADEPLVDVLAHLAQRGEHMGVEHFVAEAAVEAFDVAVLHGAAGLDVKEPNVVLFTPGDELGGDELGSVVDPDLSGQRMAVLELFEQPDDALGRQRGVDLDGQGLAHAFVEDVERAVAFAAPKRVVHEVHRPLETGLRRGVERFLDAGGQAFARPAREIEFHGAVDAQDTLVVPGVTFQPHPVEAFPKSPARMPAEHFVEPVDEGRVMSGLISGLMIVARAPQVHGTAGA